MDGALALRTCDHKIKTILVTSHSVWLGEQGNYTCVIESRDSKMASNVADTFGPNVASKDHAHYETRMNGAVVAPDLC